MFDLKLLSHCAEISGNNRNGKNMLFVVVVGRVLEGESGKEGREVKINLVSPHGQ